MKALLQRIKAAPRIAVGLCVVWAVFLLICGLGFAMQSVRTWASTPKPLVQLDDKSGEVTAIPIWAAHLTPPAPFSWTPENDNTPPWKAFTKISRLDLNQRLVSGGQLLLLHHVRIATQDEKLPSPAQLAQITYRLASTEHVHTRVLFFLPNMDPALSPWARVEFPYGEPIKVYSNADSLHSEAQQE